MNPTLTRDKAQALAVSRGATGKVIMLGLRNPASVYGENDAYTDTFGLLTPDGYTEFSLNTLPTAWTDGMACLVPGDYKLKKGLHGLHHLVLTRNADDTWTNKDDGEAYEWLLDHVGQAHPNPKYRLTYWAMVEIPPMTVIRKGQPGTHTDSASSPFHINFHHGGINTTSSEACQTVKPSEWDEIRTFIYAAMDKYAQPIVTYSLHLMD